MCAGGGRDTRSSGERNRVARFSSKQAVFLHKKTFSSQQENFLQSKINFFSQGKKCQVEGCSCTYCLPDKKMERLVIGICPTQNSLSGQINNLSFFSGTLRYVQIFQMRIYRVSQRNFSNRMLLEPHCKDAITISQHLLCRFFTIKTN